MPHIVREDKAVTPLQAATETSVISPPVSQTIEMVSHRVRCSQGKAITSVWIVFRSDHSVLSYTIFYITVYLWFQGFVDLVLILMQNIDLILQMEQD